MQSCIVKSDQAAEYYFKEGCYILEMINSVDDPALSIARARVTSGVTTRLHALKGTAERYYILSGTGLVRVGELTQNVVEGDVVCIAPGAAQQITNTSDVDLTFLALCTPRFEADNYQEL